MKKISISIALVISMFSIITGCGENNVEEKEITLENTIEIENREEIKDEVKDLVESNKEEQEEGVSISDINSDVARQNELVTQNIDITDLNIIKRQTNIDDKEDIIYVHVVGENADYKVVRNYKLLYVLYNEGWMLESAESYTDENNKNESIPLHGVDRESVENTIKTYNFCNNEFSNVKVVESEIEVVEQDTYHEVYKKILTYEYEYFSECVEMFIICDWADTYWLISVDYNNSLSLNESAYGSYSASVYNQFFSTSQTINADIYENDGTAYYSVYCEKTDNWGTSNISGQGACELKYYDASSLSFAGISGTCVLMNTEDNFTIAIFPDGIYFGNTLLDRK